MTRNTDTSGALTGDRKKSFSLFATPFWMLLVYGFWGGWVRLSGFDWGVDLSSEVVFVDGRELNLKTSEEQESALGNANVETKTATRKPQSSAATTLATTTTNYNFKVSLCSVTKDHEAYLTEWIDYHLLAVGFDTIHLIDNSEKHDLKQWYTNTRNHSLYSRVTVDHKPGRVQREATGACVKKYSNNGKSGKHFFGLFDTDEFLVFPPSTSNYTDVHALLQDYLVPYGGALTINCRFFGTANRSIYSPQPVLKRFQYRDNGTQNFIKSFVQADHFSQVRNPHSVILKAGVTHTTQYPGAKYKAPRTSKTMATDDNKPDQVAILHHYRFFSQKEYHNKVCLRGRFGSGKTWCGKVDDPKTAKTRTQKDNPKLQPIPSHALIRPGVVYDDTAWKVLAERVPKYRVFDDPAWEDFT